MTYLDLPYQSAPSGHCVNYQKAYQHRQLAEVV
jgi:hypothetical protein